MKKITVLVCLFVSSIFCHIHADEIKADATLKFAERSGEALYMDWYKPSETAISEEKPAIVFVFGGGFVRGTRDNGLYLPWFKMLTDNGYTVFSIDYRLGLKGVDKVGIGAVKAIDNAIHIGVEDLFSATNHIISHADEFGVNPEKLIVSGSSAGAIISMQAEYEICNHTKWAQVLPDGFNYCGVISFAGAILSHKGKVSYERTPCPTLMLHGTADKVVNYGQIKVFRLGFFGSDKIAARFGKFGYNYNILRYKDHGHDIAEMMSETIDDQLRFISTNIIEGRKRIVDAIIDDPGFPDRGVVGSRKELYNN